MVFLCAWHPMDGFYSVVVVVYKTDSIKDIYPQQQRHRCVSGFVVVPVVTLEFGPEWRLTLCSRSFAMDDATLESSRTVCWGSLAGGGSLFIVEPKKTVAGTLLERLDSTM